MSDSQIRIGKKVFYDNQNFRNGVRRSGHFTISESYQLEKYGDTLQQLASGSLVPENDDEQRFVKVCTGEYLPESPLEKLWLKYLDKTAPKKFHTLFGNKKVKSNSHAPVEDVLDVEE